MITAEEARRSGPIADYLNVCRALDVEICRAIYGRRTQTIITLEGLARQAGAKNFEVFESRLTDELEALGYEVSAEGIVSW